MKRNSTTELMLPVAWGLVMALLAIAALAHGRVSAGLARGGNDTERYGASAAAEAFKTVTDSDSRVVSIH